MAMVSGGAGAVFAHFEVLERHQGGEEDAEDNHAVPNLVTVPTEVVAARIIALWTAHSIYIQSSKI